MRLALLFLAFVALASAQQKACPKSSPFDGKTTVSTVPVGYAMNFEVAKAKADGALIAFDLTDNLESGVIPMGTYFYFEVDGLSTANGANFTLYVGSNSDTSKLVESGGQSGLSWSSGKAWVLLDEYNFNTMNHILYARIVALCKTCSKTAEFKVETAFVTANNGYKYKWLNLVPNLRSTAFDTVETVTSTQTNWVVFARNVTADDLDDMDMLSVYFDVTYDGTDDADSEVVAYFSKDAPPTLDNTTYIAKYPSATTKAGNWLQETPFQVDGPGIYYFAFYTKENTVGDVEYTIKAGFNDYPCSMASGLVANILLLALIPFTLFVNKF